MYRLTNRIGSFPAKMNFLHCTLNEDTVTNRYSTCTYSVKCRSDQYVFIFAEFDLFT